MNKDNNLKMDDPIRCLNCKKLIQFGSSQSVEKIKKLAIKNKSYYKYLVCSKKCYLKIVGDDTPKLEFSQIFLFRWLEAWIKYQPDFSYLILEKILKDEQKSKKWGRVAFKVDWSIFNIDTEGNMKVNDASNPEVMGRAHYGLHFGSAAFSDFELGLWDGEELSDLIVGWNNTQYIKAQNDKNYCDKELLAYKNSELWQLRKKYFDNVLTAFRDWFRIKEHTPPDIETYVEPKNYSGNPKSPTVKCLLELANEFGLRKGKTIPKDAKIEMAGKLKAKGFGERSLEYIRRTLTKFGYARPKTGDLEWGDTPIHLNQMFEESLVEPSASDDMLDDGI